LFNSIDGICNCILTGYGYEFAKLLFQPSLIAMRNGLLSILLLIVAHALHAQDFSNKGKDFWIGYGNHVRMFTTINANEPAEKMQLYVTSDVSTTGLVTITGINFSQPFTVSANQITTIDIPRSAGLFNEGLSNLGIHVTADKPVVVYSFIYVNSISGATVCLPRGTLGKEYYSVNYTQISNEPNSYSYFFAVATDTGTTTIEITPSQITKGGLAANAAFTQTLTQGQVYQVLSSFDLTGSKILSVSSATSTCKKIAVFCGSGKISIGCGLAAGTSDNLYQQMYPVSTWGKKYITVPSINATDLKGQTNFYRIFLSDLSSKVTLNGNPVNFGGNRFFEFYNNQVNYIQSDKPILVAQYFTTQGCSNNGGNGDPEMIYLNPVEQTIASVTLNSMQPSSGTNISEHYINAVLPNIAAAINSFKIDGSPLAVFTPVPQNNSYAYAQVAVSRGAHSITCDSGFNAIAYGFGNAESYGYSAGTNLKDLYQFISINNQYAIVNFPAGCKNSPLKFSMTFPYQPLQIKWQFNGLFADSTIASPAYDSTWIVNDKTLYRYSLNKYYTIPTVGTYPVKVLATSPDVDGCGGEQEINYDLQIFDRPKVSFSFSNNGCTTSPVVFTDTTNGNGRPVIKYLWDFGDGAKADSNNPVHTYSTGGYYPVKFAVITDIGCLSDTVSQNIKIFNPPAAAFSLQSAACLNKAITFTDNSTNSAGGTLVKWYWNFGDNTTIVKTDNNPVEHTYTSTGTYNVSLQVEINSGCKSTVTTIPVAVNDLPMANFTEPAICLSDPVAQFYDSSYIADNSQAAFTYLWNFGNGQTSSQKDGKSNYITAGIYDVKLTVTSNNGCVKDTTKKFTVNGAVPLAGFSVNKASVLCSNKQISITDESTVDFGSIIRTEIYWDYAGNPLAKTIDSTPLKGRSYFYKYADFGSPASKTFQVKYVVYSGISCVNEMTTTITLQASPQLQFDALSPVCEEVTPFRVTAAKDNSLFAATGVYSGKGITTAGIFNPNTAGAGIDSITYTVTAADGCSADTGQTILVYPTPVVSAGPDKFLLEGSFVILDGEASGNQLVYTWIPETYLDNAAIAKPKVTAAQDIIYTLTVVSADGCRASDDVSVKILKKIKVPNAFSPNGDGINDTWVIQYLESYPGCTVDVFNRYGQAVYHSTGYTKSWDGRLNGQPLPVGTYYWIINPKNGRTQENGSVTIIR
jgi:gliding motility-associated-like protein